jgi:hypothetical protein
MMIGKHKDITWEDLQNPIFWAWIIIIGVMYGLVSLIHKKISKWISQKFSPRHPVASTFEERKQPPKA